MDIFCKIGKKESPAHILYEDGEIMAILDIEPASPGHSLILPKKHFEKITEVPPQTLARIINLSARLAEALVERFGFDGVILHHVSGKKLQDVPHFHLHVYGKNAEEDERAYFYKTFKNDLDKKGALVKIADSLRKKLK